MNCSGASSDSDEDSEFNSGHEDIEFLLYEQLYFEPNSNITETNVKSDPPTDNGLERTSEADRTQFLQTEAFKVGNHKTLPKLTNLAPSDIQDNQSSVFEESIVIDTLDGSEHPLSYFTSELSSQDAHSDSSVHQTELQANTIHKVSFHGDAPPTNGSALPSQTGRQRLSSTCSDGSIPGSVPLDGLYCNLAALEEEAPDNDRIRDKLMIKDVTAMDHGGNEESLTAGPTKRKRTRSSSDEMEDSRCNNLITAASKNSSGKSESCHLNEDSSSDEDIYVLPPPPAVNPEVLTLDSSSDSEPEVLTKDVTRVRKQNNKFQKVEEAGKSLLVKQSGVERKSRKKDHEVCESDTDSNDVDFPEATRGTDLTLNVHRSLSCLVKTIVKDPKGKTSTTTTTTTVKRAKKPYGKSNRSCVDFTRGRPDTETKPSCEKWTQSMANFYDSDISEDFDVSEIHQQQSGSRADWKLVPDDYQVTQRRRYYNAPEKCNLCRQEGHTARKCSRVPKCHLCSGTGHTRRNDCYENCCFKCGEEPHYFCPSTDRRRSCALCGYPGHNKYLCPDLWRRFHLTTSGLIAQTPSGEYTRPPGKQYCYVCAKRGHYGHKCPLKYNNIAYSQVPQSIVSYSRPVNLVNGSLVVNIEEAQAPLPEENVTKMSVRLDQTGRIIGRKGVVVRAISKESGAHVRVITNGQPQVLLLGSSEARLKAQEIIEGHLGQKSSGKYADFLEHLLTINGSDPPAPDLKKRKSHLPSPAAVVKKCKTLLSSQSPGITDNAPTTSGFSNATTPIVIASDEDVTSVPDISKITCVPVIASTSRKSNTNFVPERNQNISWREDFLANCSRRKHMLLKRIEALVPQPSDQNYVNLIPSLRFLRRFRRMRKLEPSLEPNEKVKQSMKKIAMTVFGKGRYEEGRRIVSDMRALMYEVEMCQDKFIPEDICVKIAKTLECLHEPNIKKLSELIECGDKYRLEFIRSKALARREKKKQKNELLKKGDQSTANANKKGDPKTITNKKSSSNKEDQSESTRNANNGEPKTLTSKQKKALKAKKYKRRQRRMKKGNAQNMNSQQTNVKKENKQSMNNQQKNAKKKKQVKGKQYHKKYSAP